METGRTVPSGQGASTSAPAATPAVTAYPDPGPMSAPLAIRGLLQAITPIAGFATAMATKIEVMRAIEIWKFSESDLRTIEKPGGAFLEKYAPSIDSFGVEIEFAGALFAVLFPKVIAIVAAKKMLDAMPKAATAAPAATPAPQPAPAAAPPPPTPIRTAPGPTPVPERAAPSEDFEIEIELPSPALDPFDPSLNSQMPAAAAAAGAGF